MGVSKVNLGEETLVDLTNDTVKENNLLKGATAHGADGEPVEGGVTVAPLTTNLAVTEEGVAALDAAAGKVLNDKGGQISVYKGEDGMLHFRDWNGADTVLNFSGANGVEVIYLQSVKGMYNVVTARFDNPSLEPVYTFGYITNNMAQYFMWDFINNNGAPGTASASYTDTTITVNRSTTNSDVSFYNMWIVLA